MSGFWCSVALRNAAVVLQSLGGGREGGLLHVVSGRSTHLQVCRA